MDVDQSIFDQSGVATPMTVRPHSTQTYSSAIVWGAGALHLMHFTLALRTARG